jgi:hypothetical protein
MKEIKLKNISNMSFIFKSLRFRKRKSCKNIWNDDLNMKYEEPEEEKKIQDFDETHRDEQLKRIKEMSKEEKEEFIIWYEGELKNMEYSNVRMFGLLRIFIEKEIKRSLTSGEIEQIREKISKYDNIKDIYNIVSDF